MTPKVREQIESVAGMTITELRQRYAEVFGEETTSRHKRFLQKRIAWRLQANEEGGLTERALRRARELANDVDLRLLAPKGGKTVVKQFTPTRDRRIPVPGTIITREYRGRTVCVTVMPDGFEWGGEFYRSLSAAARAITGTRWNGLAFFGLTKRKGR
ncbi:MAG: DUF2924 domain-containing protein [Candidatus Eisenbacteria sp.]|nr:DUF2924 domain-containing protein [Candidatus Eisenbacteria bacterium]